MLSDLPSSSLTVRQRLTIGFGLLAVTGSMLTGWLWWGSVTADHLISLTPLESVVYVHARRPVFSGELGLPGLVQLLQARFSGSAPALPESLEKQLVEVDEISAFALMNDKGQLDWTVCVWRRAGIPAGSSLEQKNILALTPRIACTASSTPVFRQIQNTAAGASLSLASQLPKQRRSTRQIFFALKPRELGKLTDQIVYTKGTQLLPPVISGRASVQANGLVFDFDQTESPSRLGHASQLSVIPSASSLVMSGISLSTLVGTLADADPSWQDYLENLRESLAASAQLSTKQLQGLMDQPATLMVRFFPNQVNQVSVLVELPTQPSEVLTQLEQFLAFLLARAVPQEQTHVLPDGTSVTELFADPNKVVWQDENVSSNTVRAASSLDGRHQLMYARSAGRLLISSDRELLGEALEKTSQDVARLTRTCGFSGQPDRLAIINLSHWPSSSLMGWLALGSSKSGHLSGCLTAE